MVRVLVYALPMMLAVYALVDCLQTPTDEVRTLPRIAWLAVIVVFVFVGPIAWLLAGRERSALGALFRPAQQAGVPRPAARRTLAPDDDPDFLRKLGRGRPSAPRRPPSTDEDALLEEWERDLRRPEPRDGGPDDEGPATAGDGAPRA
ncbi:MAG: hypothetical protein QOI54_549 [Actinomycetota bacterium]|jgi:hypothetical protein|nr:hypothetical protein [Actinomycetota bacterium]